MKKILLILVLILGYNALSEAQLFRPHKYLPVDSPKLKIVYQYNFNKDSTDRDRISRRTMLLNIGDSISLFVDKNALWYEKEMDKIFTVEQLQQWGQDNINRLSHESFKILKNNSGNKLIYWDYMLGLGYLKYEEKPDFNWEITEDTMNLLGFTVQKAFLNYGGRRWEAWFAPKIPISDGPYKFMGLPGLILKMNDTKNYYVFEAITIENPQSEDFIGMQDVNFINITREKYLEMVRKFREDFLNQAAAEQLPNEQDRKRVVENLRRNNNSIELK
ncbi:MAG: GLPGLI family protein [Bacteroidota bacterium]